MSHFTPEFLQFLRELPANNNRDWFHENKKHYEQFVKFPFEKFVTDLIEAFSKEGLAVGELTAKECIFRIYRDVRFGLDKSPYKIHVSALIAPGGRKSMNSFGAYVELSGEHVRLYSGAYQPSPELLVQIRQKIYDEPERLQELISDKKFKQNFGEIRGEKNKRINKPFSEIIENQPLILNKSFYYFKNYESENVLKKDFIQRLVKDYKIIQPLNQYLEEAIK
ncbi:DUF2461 domain-containing protein [Moheibacter lacus]|uniref:DUF2461 domain-containing protein n=1 Tax=Moheibacter lacus TaxID=2745851 RepID=A0A838ZPR3_9FLAO|nr:DUF2461 domain-containing protein [Moheibacter lacus]MBA5629866.1 DUF2461 domain-containing protein [Moheibacter lacus]